MKISILTGKFGMGHMSAAQAIKQQIDNSSLDAEVEIIDWLEYVSPKLAEKCYELFLVIVNNGSRLYNARYKFMENRKTNKKPELSFYFEKHFARFMEEKKPEMIISTLPICSQIVSLYKEKTGSSIPLITCVTDITGHSEWISKNTELYMVGSESVKEKFLMKGVTSDRVYETGIPVRLEFIRDTLSESEKSSQKKRLLIMGGGLGIIPEGDEFYQNLNSNPDIEATVITGKNQKLYNELSGKYKNIRVLGYVYNICDYMKQADAVVTKPGGVTTFEAIHAGVPILVLNPFLQQEIYNAQYIEEMNIGTVIGGSSKQCLEDILNLLEHHRQLDYYRYNVRRIKKHLEERDFTTILEKVIDQKNYEILRNWNNMYRRRSEGRTINEKVSFNV